MSGSALPISRPQLLEAATEFQRVAAGRRYSFAAENEASRRCCNCDPIRSGTRIAGAHFCLLRRVGRGHSYAVASGDAAGAMGDDIPADSRDIAGAWRKFVERSQRV